MPLRSWVILFGTVYGLLFIYWGICTLYPQCRFLAAGGTALALTFTYARLTGLSWLPQIVRIIADIMGGRR